MTNLSVVQTLEQHRSIRQFSSRPVTAAVVAELIETAQHSATSMYMQQFSVIQITNQATQQQIADIANGPFIAKAPVLLVMVADQYRNAQIATAQHQDVGLLHSADKFMAAVFDTTLATAGIVNAAESMGLGATILGSIQNDGAAMIKLLHLPPLTLPILGIVLGYPAEQPEQKPRLPLDQVLFKDYYQPVTGPNLQLNAYSELVQHYYATRSTNSRNESFEQMIVENLQKHPAKRNQLLKVIHQQGFLLN